MFFSIVTLEDLHPAGKVLIVMLVMFRTRRLFKFSNKGMVEKKTEPKKLTS